ncbi:MAG: hypothetical protein MRY57_00915, partial [Candidatus Pacebacteria bacterium]|nr:hypothetical protein [Candidatus Paceibacterota bacterium]
GKKEEQLKSEITRNEYKAEYSEKKNDLIKLCMYALVSMCTNDVDKKNKIVDFTNKLQLSFQYLDDIADLKEDLKDKNYTVILNTLLQKVSIENINEDNLISLLIENKVLLNFVSNIVDLFKDINSMIDNKISSSSKTYFNNISKNLDVLHIYLKGINLDLFKLDERYKVSKIKEVEKRIEIVASSS